ncbi:unnamed protein product [Prunus armeniaca]|uniref:Uncharacterized protein n=1 Tax=Prunus armeniaca TaxID=36596 RepID=A0A6J5TEQ0_PRUAR|nr:unnamed protein product [Prunus armeniaca]
MVQGNPGSFNAALQQIQARSQQTTDIKSEVNMGLWILQLWAGNDAVKTRNRECSQDPTDCSSDFFSLTQVFPSEGKLLASAGHDKKIMWQIMYMPCQLMILSLDGACTNHLPHYVVLKCGAKIWSA